MSARPKNPRAASASSSAVMCGTSSEQTTDRCMPMARLSALTTIVLVGVTLAALRERYYSAVMAATGLLYLAILTAFGTDLIARALLANGAT